MKEFVLIQVPSNTKARSRRFGGRCFPPYRRKTKDAARRWGTRLSLCFHHLAAVAWRHGLGLFWQERPRSIALRTGGSGEGSLAFQFFDSLVVVVGAGERGEEGDYVIYVGLGKSKRLDIFVEIGIVDSISLVVVIHHVPKRLLRAVMEIGRGYEDVAKIWRFEGGDGGLLLGDEEASEDGHIRLDGGLIDSKFVA